MLDIFILSASPALGWLVALVFAPARESVTRVHHPMFSILEITSITLGGAALIAPFTLLSQWIIQRRAVRLTFGEWAWWFQFAVVLLVLGFSYAELSSAFWIVLLAQLLSGVFTIAWTIGPVAGCASGTGSLHSWSDTAGRCITTAISGLVVYRILF